MKSPVHSGNSVLKIAELEEKVRLLEKKIEELNQLHSESGKGPEPGEDELRWSDSSLRMLLNFTDQGIVVVDSIGHIVEWNSSVEQVTGISREKVLNRYVWDVQHDMAASDIRVRLDRAAFRRFWEEGVFRMKEGDVYQGDGRAINSEGKEEYIQDLIRPVIINGERYYCSFQTYLTRLKQTEEELRKKVEELALANRELEIYTYANNDLKQFAYTASHQLQEPIRTVSNYTKILEEDYSQVLDEKALNYLYIVRYASERMSLLINTLLEYSRVGRKSTLSLVDCRIVIDRVLEDLAYMIESTGAKITVEKMPVIYLYDNEFRQLMYNLLNNALKFRHNGVIPEIVVQAEKQDDKFVFSVKDNGIGIDPMHNERIFEIFQRLHINEDVYEGKGVGLALCRKIVNMHKGRIWVESVAGNGSDFRFSIPIN